MAVDRKTLVATRGSVTEDIERTPFQVLGHGIVGRPGVDGRGIERLVSQERREVPQLSWILLEIMHHERVPLIPRAE